MTTSSTQTTFPPEHPAFDPSPSCLGDRQPPGIGAGSTGHGSPLLKALYEFEPVEAGTQERAGSHGTTSQGVRTPSTGSESNHYHPRRLDSD